MKHDANVNSNAAAEQVQYFFIIYIYVFNRRFYPKRLTTDV